MRGLKICSSDCIHVSLSDLPCLCYDLPLTLATVHPLIHLGCGLEFGQPAIIAEALALVAVHTSPLSGFPPEAEKAAAMIGKPTRKSLAQILEDIRTDDRISAVLSWTEGNKFQNGPVQKANKAMVEHASQWNMDTDDLDRFMAETVNNLGIGTRSQARLPWLTIA